MNKLINSVPWKQPDVLIFFVLISMFLEKHKLV